MRGHSWAKSHLTRSHVGEVAYWRGLAWARSHVGELAQAVRSRRGEASHGRACARQVRVKLVSLVELTGSELV